MTVFHAPVATLKPLDGLHIEARRWFQRTAGNTYHSVRIYANNAQLVYLPFSYGYGEQWLQTALDWLATHGYIPAAPCAECAAVPQADGIPRHMTAAQYGTQYLREELHGTYSLADVSRKKDL